MRGRLARSGFGGYIRFLGLSEEVLYDRMI